MVGWRGGFVERMLRAVVWLASKRAMAGTLTVKGLVSGQAYDVYRWDSVKAAFTYTDGFRKTSFKETDAQFVYVDDKSFMSNGTTYYSCVQHE